MIEEIEDSIDYSPFDNLEIIASVMDNFLHEILANMIKTPYQLVNYVKIKVEWFYIYEGLRRHQKGENISRYNFSQLLLLLRNSPEEDDRDFVEKFDPFLDYYKKKHINKYILIKIETFIKMYKALKVGWMEIENFYPLQTYNSVFLGLLMAYYADRLFQSHNSVKSKYWHYLPKIIIIKKFHEPIKKYLEVLSKNKNLDETSRKLCNSTIEEYERESYGQGLNKAIDALKEVAKKDPYIAGELKEYYKSLSAIGAYSNLKSFDDFLQCPNPGYSIHNKDIELTDYAVIYQAFHIKEIFLESPNPRVRKMVSEWLGVSEKMIAFQRTQFQRNAERKKIPIDENI